MNDSFPRPADIYDGQVCTATGNQATSGYESHDELLIKGSGPYLPCDQLSVYQQSELTDAMGNINKGPYSGGAIDTIYRYRSAAEGNGDSIQDYESSDSNGDINDNFNEDEEPPIEPLN
jgi:hypothetical protein